MSVYENCADAVRELIDSARLHASEHRGFFTDLDVVIQAVRIAGGYDEMEMKQAIREAKNVLQKMYKRGLIARYGPVYLSGIDSPDYARIATCIVHASLDGPGQFETPNGKFKRITVKEEKTSIRAPGRRYGANRDDRHPWEEQPELREQALKSQLAVLHAQTN